MGWMSSKFENIFRINRKSFFATLGGFETPGAFFFRVYLNLKHSVFSKCLWDKNGCEPLILISDQFTNLEMIIFTCQ